MESITELWDDEVGVETYTDADFETRDKSLSCYDKHGVFRDALNELSERFNLKVSETADLAVRLYLGALADSDDITIRDNFDQSRLIPPKQWVEDHSDELPQFNIIEDNIGGAQYETPQFSPSTTPTVHEMIGWVNDEHGVHDGLTPFVKSAINFVCAGYMLNSEYELQDKSDPTQFTSYRISDEFDNVFPLNTLTDTDSRQKLLKYFLTADIPERGYNKSEIAREVGISKNAIRRNLDPFIAYNLVELTTDPDARISKYRVREESEVFKALKHADSALQEFYNDG